MIQDPHLFRYLETYCKQEMHLVPVTGHDWQGDWDLGKQPLISIYEASHDMAVVEAWAKRWPGCNWGWVPQQGHANLDVDPRHGGDVALAKLEAKYGPLPLVPRVRTGGGGWHDTFAVPADLAFDVDIEGNEGLTFSSGKRQFLLPPSIHRNGQPYACERKFTTTPTHPATDWLLGFASPKATPKGGNVRAVLPPVAARPMRFKAAAGSLADDPGTTEGSRRKTLVRLLGIELARGRAVGEIEPDALAWGERCTPPLQESEVLRCLDSLAKRHDARSVLAISGTAHPHPQEMERPLPGTGKEGINSAAVQAVGLEPDRPDFIPSFRAAEVEDASVGDFIPSFRAEPDEPPLAANLPSKAAMLQAQGRTVAWAKEFVPSFRLPDADAFTLPPEARIGFLKDFAFAVEPQIEGDIGPVVACLLTAFGSAIGHGPHVTVGAGRHYANLNGCTVAPSGIGKSEPWDIVLRLMELADAAWLENCICNGLGSGEGLVERLRDGWTEAKPDKQGQMQFVQHPGAAHKNLLVIEAEFGRVINLGRRDGATLSQILCFGWDGKTMEVANRGQNKLKASDHHLSIWANITLAEIRRKIRNSLEEENGFVNRFLWPWQSLRRSLPFGGDMACLDALAPVLAQAIGKAKGISQVRWAACGAALWERAYPKLKAVQTHMEVLGRARSQALRLSLLFAMLDGSDEIREAHVTAGLAAWAYAEASARLIFGDEPAAVVGSATAPPMATAVLKAITHSPGVSRKGLYDALGHDVKAEALSEALLWLEDRGHAYRRMMRTGSGRPAECWWPTQGRDAGPQPHPPDRGNAEDGAGSEMFPAPCVTPGNSSFLPGPVAEADADEELWKEGTISDAHVIALEDRKEGIKSQLVANAQATVEVGKEGMKSQPVLAAQATAEAGKEGMKSPVMPKPSARPEDSSFLPTPPAASLHGGGVVCAVQPSAPASRKPSPRKRAETSPAWALADTPPGHSRSLFAFDAPVPDGWLDQEDDAEVVAAIWPVPDGWTRYCHASQHTDRGERHLFNPKWPVNAMAPSDGSEDFLDRLVAEDPEVCRVIQPQPLAS